ncbi:aminoglycoside 3'-phosphotransferase [Nesterenkonia muleiensis]|uniref:aminoglycoside 3'-phosphotransferase n=1 Tax=Nesterenkonia muleiensis TaxID=2282648 RepID=UPI000E7335E0|nr:aminoglycoside 3'-phosphotransferase [Nesterenkonia muleiensis]
MNQPSASVPQGEVEVPERVLERAAGDSIKPIWRNELGGMTFRLAGAHGTRYLKWQDYTGLGADRHAEVDLGTEAEKLAWANRFVTVPQVLDSGVDGQEAWLLTAGIDASAAYHPRWRAEPETAVRAIASGLRHLHDSLPVANCPFTVPWAHPEQAPAPERLVVCHGDPCVPNTLLDDEGNFAAHVDLGALGVADRWADLAIATYSISWEVNFGRNYDDLFFSVYGVEPDQDRIAFYRNLWDDG